MSGTTPSAAGGLDLEQVASVLRATGYSAGTLPPSPETLMEDVAALARIGDEVARAVREAGPEGPDAIDDFLESDMVLAWGGAADGLGQKLAATLEIADSPFVAAWHAIPPEERGFMMSAYLDFARNFDPSLRPLDVFFMNLSDNPDLDIEPSHAGAALALILDVGWLKDSGEVDAREREDREYERERRAAERAGQAAWEQRHDPPDTTIMDEMEQTLVLPGAGGLSEAETGHTPEGRRNPEGEPPTPTPAELDQISQTLHRLGYREQVVAPSHQTLAVDLQELSRIGVAIFRAVDGVQADGPQAIEIVLQTEPLQILGATADELAAQVAATLQDLDAALAAEEGMEPPYGWAPPIRGTIASVAVVSDLSGRPPRASWPTGEDDDIGMAMGLLVNDPKLQETIDLLAAALSGERPDEGDYDDWDLWDAGSLPSLLIGGYVAPPGTTEAQVPPPAGSDVQKPETTIMDEMEQTLVIGGGGLSAAVTGHLPQNPDASGDQPETPTPSSGGIRLVNAPAAVWVVAVLAAVFAIVWFINLVGAPDTELVVDDPAEIVDDDPEEPADPIVEDDAEPDPVSVVLEPGTVHMLDNGVGFVVVRDLFGGAIVLLVPQAVAPPPDTPYCVMLHLLIGQVIDGFYYAMDNGCDEFVNATPPRADEWFGLMHAAGPEDVFAATTDRAIVLRSDELTERLSGSGTADIGLSMQIGDEFLATPPITIDLPATEFDVEFNDAGQFVVVWDERPFETTPSVAVAAPTTTSSPAQTPSPSPSPTSASPVAPAPTTPAPTTPAPTTPAPTTPAPSPSPTGNNPTLQLTHVDLVIPGVAEIALVELPQETYQTGPRAVAWLWRMTSTAPNLRCVGSRLDFQGFSAANAAALIAGGCSGTPYANSTGGVICGRPGEGTFVLSPKYSNDPGRYPTTDMSAGVYGDQAAEAAAEGVAMGDLPTFPGSWQNSTVDVIWPDGTKQTCGGTA